MSPQDWSYERSLRLVNGRLPEADGLRQAYTAEEIVGRLRTQPGLILADEVGMGKTFVALAVATSVLESEKRRRPVVVMVPPSVAEKWTQDWQTFCNVCAPDLSGLRAAGPVRSASQFLMLLDDPKSRRNHLIVMTHGAMQSALQDPFIKLAIVHFATRNRPALLALRPHIAKVASSLFNESRFRNVELVQRLLNAHPSGWRDLFNAGLSGKVQPLDDDPVPKGLTKAIIQADLREELDGVRAAIESLPLRRSSGYDQRMDAARRALNSTTRAVWAAAMQRGALPRLPLLILDEAHHVKNPNQLAGLFMDPSGLDDDAAHGVRGALSDVFDRMLFLTATPFQLGHGELIAVLERFTGTRLTSGEKEEFAEQRRSLERALERARADALYFESAWRSTDAAALAGVRGLDDVVDDEDVERVLHLGRAARASLASAHELLAPWVVRHTKSNRSERRLYVAGRDVCSYSYETAAQGTTAAVGIDVGAEATLPFLLAARAEALLEAEARNSGHRNPVFAYGLASSYEAYRRTRRNGNAERDDSDSGAADESMTTRAWSPRVRRYIREIERVLPDGDDRAWANHPKIAATTEAVVRQWSAGEKVLVFCFYQHTGRALLRHISGAIRAHTAQRARVAMSMAADDTAVFEELRALETRLLRADSPGRRAFESALDARLAAFDGELRRDVIDIAVRFMRTPSFMVRYLDLGGQPGPDELAASMDSIDTSGTTLGERLFEFAAELVRRPESRQQKIDGLKRLQTGVGRMELDDSDASEEGEGVRRESIEPNVRLANGGVRRETRLALMEAFNSPFFPDVLIASAVMSEGVDLQRNCRHVIHHDLDWNPAVLEQRTGRVDRIGSKGGTGRQPIVVMEPFLGGTHDEKMYRVVKDRERWFGVVMGDAEAVRDRVADSSEDSAPLPESISAELALDLSVYPPAKRG